MKPSANILIIKVHWRTLKLPEPFIWPFQRMLFSMNFFKGNSSKND